MNTTQMDKYITNVIKDNNQFDGIYYEYFLETPVPFNAEEDAIRLIINENDEIVVHIMNKLDESRFIRFNDIDRDRQHRIYSQMIK